MSEDQVGVTITPALQKRLDDVLQDAGFARRETEAAKKLADSTEPTQRPLLTDGDMSERTAPGYDVYSLSDEERKQYGFGDNEVHQWVRNPKRWEHAEGYDGLAAFLREKPGRRVIMRGSSFVTNGDLVLVAVPRAEIEQRDRALAEAVADADYRLTQGDVSPQTPRFKGGPTRDEAFFAHEEHKASGFIRGDGMTPEEMLARLGPKRVAEIEAYYRNGGMNIPVPEDPREQQEYEDRRRAVNERSKNRKSFSMGAGFDKNGRIVR